MRSASHSGRAPHVGAQRPSQLAVHVDEVAAACALVQIVDVLGDEEQVVRDGPLESCERAVRGVGDDGCRGAAPRVVEAQHRVGVALVSLWCRDVLDLVPLPEPAGIAERGHAALGGDAGARQHDDPRHGARFVPGATWERTRSHTSASARRPSGDAGAGTISTREPGSRSWCQRAAAAAASGSCSAVHDERLRADACGDLAGVVLVQRGLGDGHRDEGEAIDGIPELDREEQCERAGGTDADEPDRSLARPPPGRGRRAPRRRSRHASRRRTRRGRRDQRPAFRWPGSGRSGPPWPPGRDRASRWRRSAAG